MIIKKDELLERIEAECKSSEYYKELDSLQQKYAYKYGWVTSSLMREIDRLNKKLQSNENR